MMMYVYLYLHLQGKSKRHAVFIQILLAPPVKLYSSLWFIQ